MGVVLTLRREGSLFDGLSWPSLGRSLMLRVEVKSLGKTSTKLGKEQFRIQRRVMPGFYALKKDWDQWRKDEVQKWESLESMRSRDSQGWGRHFERMSVLPARPLISLSVYHRAEFLCKDQGEQPQSWCSKNVFRGSQVSYCSATNNDTHGSGNLLSPSQTTRWMN